MPDHHAIVLKEPTVPIVLPRVTLRPLTEADFADHCRLFGDPSVVRYLYEEVMTGEVVRDHFDKRVWMGLPETGEWANLAVEHEGQFLGEVGFGLSDAEHGICEVGYVFLPEAGGRGLATEAVVETVDLCFRSWRCHRVTARMDGRNERSAAMARRVGMREEAHFRENEWVKGEWTDEKVFAVLRGEWTARHL